MTKKQETINLRQKKFCELFATDKEFFGNGTQSYIEAYSVPASKYNSAGACAARLLKDVKILAYIDNIMAECGFNNQHANKQLSFLMTQNAELGVKLGAIRHFNDLKQRITQKIEANIVSEENVITESELLARLTKIKEAGNGIDFASIEGGGTAY